MKIIFGIVIGQVLMIALLYCSELRYKHGAQVSEFVRYRRTVLQLWLEDKWHELRKRLSKSDEAIANWFEGLFEKREQRVQTSEWLINLLSLSAQNGVIRSAEKNAKSIVKNNKREMQPIKQNWFDEKKWFEEFERELTQSL